MVNELVSIITPAYCCKDTFAATYDSIKNQSYENWEWIVVEDNSCDGTFEFIKTLVGDDKKVRLFQTKQNGGAALARNIGISNANGRYIAFLDADDLWKKDKLNHQISFMEKGEYAFTFTDYDLLYSNGTTKPYSFKKDRIDYKRLLRSNRIGCLTVIYDVEKLGKVYMPLDCEKREDHGAWLDILKTGVYGYRFDESLAYYRIGNTSVSSKKFKMMKYQYRLYRKHEKFSVFKSFFYTLICSINRIAKKY